MPTERFTVEQRKGMYLSAFKQLLKRHTGSNLSPYICDAISCQVSRFNGANIFHGHVVCFFPEFSLFEPKEVTDKRREGLSYYSTKTGLGWFDREDKESRLNTLLLCAEMCD